MDPNTATQQLLAVPPEQHLLEGPVSTQSLKELLPASSSLAALEQLRQWLGELVALGNCPLEHCLDVIEQVDKLADLYQLRLVPQYLDTQRMRKIGESEIWQTTFAYWHQLGDAYRHCLLRFQAAPDELRDFRPHLPLVLTRLLHNLSRQHYWTLLRYAHLDGRIWHELGQSYLLAESWGLADRHAALHPGRAGESTPKQELLKTLMLAMAAPEALPPTQLYIAERVAARLGSQFALHATAGPGCTFCFDLSLHQPPRRAQGGAAAVTAPLLRFFGAGTSALGLQKLLAAARQPEQLQRELGLHSELSPDDMLKTLQHLERHWADARPARRSEREHVMSRLTVLPGLLPALHWLGELQKSGAAETPINPRAENWVVSDHSAGGFGAILPAQPSDWLSVGTLIITRLEGSAAPRVGLLKRITTDNGTDYRVGVELIGQQAARVTLHPTLTAPSEGLASIGQAAILLSLKPDEQGGVDLLLPPHALTSTRHLKMQVGSKIFIIDSPVTVGQGPDYRLVRYRLDRPD